MKLLRRRKWYVAGGLLVIVALMASLIAKRIDGFAMAMGCTDRVLSAATSPDEKYVAYVFRRSCGATATDSIQINMQPTETSHDGDRYKAFFVVDGESEVTIRWDSGNQLTVNGTVSGRIFRRDHVVGDTQIRYAE